MKNIRLFLGFTAMAIGLLPLATFAQTPQISLSPIENPNPIVSPIRICPFDTLMLKQGDNGDEVKTLQSLLAQDATIYPLGVTSGYFGRLTQDAVRKLQAKNGIAQTGTIDQPTRNIIFPCTTIRVVAPNGGETWQVGATYQIQWESRAPYYMMDKSQTGSGIKALFAQKGTTPPSTAIYPYSDTVSIDLTQNENVVYHIGSASLYSDPMSFSWTIPSSISESNNYKVRVSIWKNVPPPMDCTPPRACPMIQQMYPRPWSGYTWDESDAPFTITGGTVISPTPTPMPDNTSLIQIRQHISDALSQIQSALMLLNKLLAGTPVQ